MLADVMRYLRCPHCARALVLADRCVRCAAGHTFDVARQGYVSLLAGDAPGDAGDTPAMVRAREEFLAAGHYAPLAEWLAGAAQRALGEAPSGCVVDVGAGTGYYLARLLDRLPGGIGLALDISKHASKRAARTHPRIGAVRCDAWRALPVAGDTASLLLDVFAPRNGPEFHRVLRPEGLLLVVTPTPRHLTELVTGLGLLTVDERKAERLARAFGRYFAPVDSETCEQTVSLSHADVAAVATMGPSAWHNDGQLLHARIAGLPSPVPVTLSVTVTVFHPVQVPSTRV